MARFPFTWRIFQIVLPFFFPRWNQRIKCGKYLSVFQRTMFQNFCNWFFTCSVLVWDAISSLAFSKLKPLILRFNHIYFQREIFHGRVIKSVTNSYWCWQTLTFCVNRRCARDWYPSLHGLPLTCRSATGKPVQTLGGFMNESSCKVVKFRQAHKHSYKSW